VFTPGLSPRLDSTPTLGSQDSNGFLVAIAAQERRVLELKEELGRAEAGLNKLKRQWAVHEAKKKRAEIKNIEKLRPLQITQDVDNSNATEDDQNAVKKSIEMDRRRAILEGVTKDSRRKVITGSHTRTLSLLSPDRSTYDHFTPPSITSDGSSEETGPSSRKARNPSIVDTDTIPVENIQNKARHSYQGGPTGGVKQMAEDLRAGLWTFMEDLRQATVGDEVVQRPSNEMSSKRTPHGVSKKGSKESVSEQNLHRNLARGRIAAGSSAKGEGTASPFTGGLTKPKAEPSARGPHTPSMKKLHTDDDGLTGADEDWLNWDSPDLNRDSPWDSSTVASPSEVTQTRIDSPFNVSRNPFDYISTVSGSSSPRHDESPWPALSNFAPGNLKRTATAIMKEWEKSLTPPAESRKDPLSFSSSSSSKTPIDEHEARISLSNLP